MTSVVPDGYKAVFIHYRFENADGQIEPRGGETICELQRMSPGAETGVCVARCSALCSPYDTYSKKRGRDIALGRAICALTGEAERRRERRASANRVVGSA